MGIAQQLEPYIKSITGMMEQIQPEVGRSAATSAAVGSTAAPNNQQTAEQSLQQVNCKFNNEIFFSKLLASLAK